MKTYVTNAFFYFIFFDFCDDIKKMKCPLPLFVRFGSTLTYIIDDTTFLRPPLLSPPLPPPRLPPTTPQPLHMFWLSK